jgi:hypothetical protein
LACFLQLFLLFLGVKEVLSAKRARGRFGLLSVTSAVFAPRMPESLLRLYPGWLIFIIAMIEIFIFIVVI